MQVTTPDPEKMRKMLGISKEEAGKMRNKILGRYPLLGQTLQRIPPPATVGGSKLKQVILDDVKTMDVDVTVNLDYSEVEKRIASQMYGGLGIPGHLMGGMRGGKTLSLKRTVVYASGNTPTAAAWYPMTEVEVEAEYDAMFDEGRLTLVHDSVTLKMPDSVLKPYAKADAAATLKFFQDTRLPESLPVDSEICDDYDRLG